MEATQVRDGYELWRPNREKAQSKTTKAIVAFVLLVSAALIAVIVIGGWERMQSPIIAIMSLVWAALYVFFALMIANWNRGLLPVVCVASGDHDHLCRGGRARLVRALQGRPRLPASPRGPDRPSGRDPHPRADLLVIVALIAFSQEWHVEEERPVGGRPLAGEDDEDGAPQAPPSPSPA